MKKIRILTLASVFALSGLMTGCFEDSSNGSPTLADTRLDNPALTADGTSATTIRGIVSDDAAGLKVTFKVLNSANADKTSDFDITFTQVPSADKDWSIGDPAKGKGSIKAKTTAANGTYTLVITVTDADGASTSANVTMTVTGGSTQPTTLKDTTVDMRASSSSLAGPPYLDVDAMVTYGSAAASANSAVVDLRFNNTSSSSEAGEIRAPSAAEAGTSMAGWTTKNATKFHKVTGKYATTNTQAGIDALYNAGSAVDHIVVANGDEIVVKSVTNKIVLIKINSITGPGTADVQFSVKGYK